MTNLHTHLHTRTATRRPWRRTAAALALTGAVASAVLVAPSADAISPSSTPSWARQFGTIESDQVVDVAVSRTGVVYSVGYTAGSLSGTSKGLADIWVARHNTSGTRRWTRQFGTSSIEYAHGIAVSPLGEIFVIGASEGSLVGTNSNPGYTDGFIAKYDQYGRRSWIRQIASSNGGDDDPTAISINSSGEIFVAGTTTGDLTAPGANQGGADLWLARYDRNGNRAWIQQYGTNADDLTTAVTADSTGRVFVVGETEGSFPSTTPNAGARDFFMVGFDRNGTGQGTFQWGTVELDSPQGVVTGPSGEVYVAGFTDGTVATQTSAGGRDAVLFRIDLDPAPEISWAKQLGTDLSDEWADIAVRGTAVYVGGHSVRSLAQPTAGGYDFVAARFDTNGARKWIDQFGTNGNDFTAAVAVSRSGDLYLAGGTEGTLAATNAGSNDAVVVRYSAARNNSWVTQQGSVENDYFYGVTVATNGAVWATGTSAGAEWGSPEGGLDVILAKYDGAGNALGVFRFGTPQTEYALAAAAGPSGSVVVVGTTGGDLAGINGGVSLGDYDGFIAMFDTNGALLWKRQVGSIYFDTFSAVTVSSTGDVYATGTFGGSVEGLTWLGESDVVIAKYDKNGVRKWLRQTGTPGADYANGIGVTRTGAVYVAGNTDHTFATPSTGTVSLPFVMRYTTGGTRRWARQYSVTDGAGDFTGLAVTPYGDVYVAGTASGSMQAGVGFAGVRDLVVARIDGNGNRRWTRQYGTAGSDRAYGIAVTALGTVTVVGTTEGTMGVNEGTPWATPAAGDDDIVVMKFDRNGRRTTVRQWGTSAYDEAAAVAVSPRGTAYIVGSTAGVLGTSSAGDMDAITIRFNT